VQHVRIVAMARRAATRGWLLALAGGLAAGLLLGAPQAGRAQTATPRYPDLKTQPPSGLRYDQVTVNGVLQWVIRFDNTAWNAGTGPLHLVPVNSGDRTTVWQYVYAGDTASGEPVERHNVGESEFHPSHNHWHFQDFAKYELYTRSDWDRRTGQKRGEGSKTTFCIIDTTRVSGALPARYTDCAQTSVTGLTVGWGDTYGANLADQWVVVGQSKLADGEYVLRSVVDPLNKLYESANKNGPSEATDANQALRAFSVCSGAISLSGCGTSGGPANDNFAAAAALGVPGSASAQTQSATTEVGEPRPCASIGQTVWYRVVPGSSGTLTASTAGSGFDTALALYSGSSLTALTVLGCNDDVDLGGDLTSRVSANVTAGRTYYLQAGGYNGDNGSLALNVSMGGTTPPPPTATNVHVGDLDATTQRSGNTWRASVTSTVHDAKQDAPVAGATVSGAWSGGHSGGASCTTSTSGTCTVSTGSMNRRTTTSVSFSATAVTGASMTYTPGSNHDPDGSSNGTTITVRNPY